jgi:hypothetical protein
MQTLGLVVCADALGAVAGGRDVTGETMSVGPFGRCASLMRLCAGHADECVGAFEVNGELGTILAGGPTWARVGYPSIKSRARGLDEDVVNRGERQTSDAQGHVKVARGCLTSRGQVDG